MSSLDDLFSSRPFVTSIKKGFVEVSKFEKYPVHPKLPHSILLPSLSPSNVTFPPSLEITLSPASFHPSIHVYVPPSCDPGRLVLLLSNSFFLDPYQWGRSQLDPTDIYTRYTEAYILGGPIELEQPVVGPNVWNTSLILIDWTLPLPQLKLPLHVRVHPPTNEGYVNLELPSSYLQLHCPPPPFSLQASSPIQWKIPTAYLHHQTWVPVLTHLVIWIGLSILFYAMLSRTKSTSNHLNQSVKEEKIRANLNKKKK